MEEKRVFGLNWRVLLPVGITLVVVAYLFWRFFDPEALKQVEWSWRTVLLLVGAFCMVVLRHLVLMGRLRLLTGTKNLSWLASFQVVTLWEFAAMVAPAVVGGSSAALYLLFKERLPFGRVTAIVLAVVFLDHLFFVVLAPLIMLMGERQLLMPVGLPGVASMGFAFWVGYLIFSVYTMVLFVGLFVNPEVMPTLLGRVFSLPGLRRWQKGAVKVGMDMVVTSSEFRDRGVVFWLYLFLLTGVVWSLRSLVANFLIVPFSLDGVDHLLAYCRQVVMWVLLLVAPTPGGSGVAELSFFYLLADMVLPGTEPVLTFLWRLIAFYPYLVAGVVVLPLWWRRVSAGSGNDSTPSSSNNLYRRALFP